jgi:hypothetical protein
VRGRLGSASLGLLAFTAIIKLIAHPIGLEFLAGLVIVGTVASLCPVVLYLLIAQITLEGDRVTWRKIVRRGSFLLSDIGETHVTRSIETFGGSAPIIKVDNKSGGRIFSMSMLYWPERSATQFQDFLARRFYDLE